MNTKEFYMNNFGISSSATLLGEKAEDMAKDAFIRAEKIAEFNQMKVLKAFMNNNISEQHFMTTTGYGYDDLGRDTLDKVYAEVFGAEAALVRQTIVNGTHAIASCLFGVLRPGDTLVAVTGRPYDTLEEVIGIRGENNGSLREYGVNYKEVALKDNKPDYEGIKNAIDDSVKAVAIQRSRGYAWRESFSVDEIGKIIKCVKDIRSDIICIVDNCYGEFVEEREPTQVGADLIVGSLIKNPGGGLAKTGGYIAGRKECVEKVSYRVTCPGIGAECGATLGENRYMYQGFFMAPHIVCQAVKAAIYCGCVFSLLGFDIMPGVDDERTDIIQAVKFGNKENLVSFCQGIQSGSPIDSFVVPMPWDMPGYENEVIMAAGAFVQGSSIEISADGPIREPFVAYYQGGLTYESAKVAILKAADKVIGDRQNG